MPANIMLPTSAKITALVCSGRRRPKVVNDVSKLSCGKLSCSAITSPTSRPTAPQPTLAQTKPRTTPSS